MHPVSADVDDGGCLPPLNSPNLLKLGSSLTDKNAFLRSYIRTQEAYLASYAVEGKSGAPPTDIGTPKKTRTVLRDFEIESGFGTPVLKHRTISIPTDPTPPVKKSRLEDELERASVAPGRVRHGDDTQRDKTVVERSGRPKERAVDPNISRKAKNPPEKPPTTINDQGQARKSTEKDKCGRAETSKRKRRGSGSDDEHRNRLEERRERRRAKKAIVAPKPPPPESDSDEDTEPKRERRAGKASKKSKKGKGLSMPAGLALMHGFSATNIGKNRLTVKLDPVVGVFNKGKASAKTVVKRSKPTKPYLKLFSEDRFLSKTLGHNKGDDADSNASSDQHQDRDDDHARNEDGASASRAKPRKKHATPPRANKGAQKRARSPSSASGSSSREEHDLHPPPNKPHKRPRAESPTWDIELEEGKLPSESDPDTSVLSRAETKADGTVILDMRATGAKWLSAAPEKQSRTEEVVPTEDAALDEKRSEISSIAPSNSASQTASRRPDLDAGGVSMFSKYFSALDPPVAEPAVSYRMPDAPPSPPLPALQQASPKHGGNFTVTQNPGYQDTPDPHYGPTSGGSVTMPVSSIASAARMVERSVSPPVPSAFPQSPLVSTSPLGFLSGPPSPALSGFLARPTTFDSSAFASTRKRYHTSGTKRQQQRPNRNHARRSTSAHRSPERYANEYDLEQHEVQSASNDFACPDGYSRSPQLDGLELSFQSVSPVFLSDLTARAVRYAGGDDVSELEVYAGFSEGYCDESPVDLVSLTGQRELDPAYPGEDERLAYHRDDCLGVSGHDEDWRDEELYDDLYPLDGAPGGSCDELPLTYCALEEAVYDDVYCVEGSGDIPAERSDFVSDDFAFDPELTPGAGTDLEEDLGYDSASDPEDQSVLGSLQRFSQGRALLMGVAELGPANDGQAGVSKAEEDVAKSLKGHWQRQRF